jgi:hypothetical protein
MLVYFVKQSAVINSIYLKQLVLLYLVISVKLILSTRAKYYQPTQGIGTDASTFPSFKMMHFVYIK